MVGHKTNLKKLENRNYTKRFFFWSHHYEIKNKLLKENQKKHKRLKMLTTTTKQLFGGVENTHTHIRWEAELQMTLLTLILSSLYGHALSHSVLQSLP